MESAVQDLQQATPGWIINPNRRVVQVSKQGPLTGLPAGQRATPGRHTWLVRDRRGVNVQFQHAHRECA